MRPRAVARSLGGTSSKVVNDKLSSSKWQLCSDSRKKSWSFCQSVCQILVVGGISLKEFKPEAMTGGWWHEEKLKERSRRQHRRSAPLARPSPGSSLTPPTRWGRGRPSRSPSGSSPVPPAWTLPFAPWQTWGWNVLNLKAALSLLLNATLGFERWLQFSPVCSH